MTTRTLIEDLKAILLFLEHHPDALENGDFGSYSLLPLENLATHAQDARRGLSELEKVIRAETRDIAVDLGHRTP